MPSRILIRDVPEDLHGWLRDRSHELRVSQNELALSLLRDAHRGNGTLALFEQPAVQVPEPQTAPFTFIDLFAGIGGLRFALQKVGGRCVFSSEWDKYCQKTYLKWFGELPAGDITKIGPNDIPDHDLLSAGFPCQPFSIAGVSKKKSLGRSHGFKDKTQGTLFFHVAKIIDAKRPAMLLLENVKNLKSHDGGKTWQVIEGTLRELGYNVFAKVIDAAHWVPQHRERIFIAGFDRKVFGDAPEFRFPDPPSGERPRFATVMESKPDPKYTLSDHLWGYLQDYAKKHKAAGNGFGFGLVNLDGVSRTLSARYFKDGSEILVPQSRKNPRRLTPQEAGKLMGFDPDLPIVVSDTQAYRQFGNAVVPPVATAVARQMVKTMCWQVARTRSRSICWGDLLDVSISKSH